uniref:Secreted protein n=1 Tax=Heterorhabditis bacteriophora TaxID=37862 RepID=A0A1I7WQZ3_HETBA
MLSNFSFLFSLNIDLFKFTLVHMSHLITLSAVNSSCVKYLERAFVRPKFRIRLQQKNYWDSLDLPYFADFVFNLEYLI